MPFIEQVEFRVIQSETGQNTIRMGYPWWVFKKENKILFDESKTGFYRCFNLAKFKQRRVSNFQHLTSKEL